MVVGTLSLGMNKQVKGWGVSYGVDGMGRLKRKRSDAKKNRLPKALSPKSLSVRSW